VRYEYVGVPGDARVKSRSFFPFGVAVCGIVASDWTPPNVQAAHCDTFVD
jgi:hypothetical protein